MKKLIKKLLPAVVLLGFLTACEDVPAPYYLLEKIIDRSVILDESFANSLGKWTIYNETEDGYEWANKYNTAYISGYQNSVNKATKSWLISPAVDLSDVEKAYLTFEYVLRFKRASTTEAVRVSSDYDGDPLTCHWEDLDIKMQEGTDYNTFFTTGANLPASVMGNKKVVIAFYYEAPANEASTWEVKNLLVKEGEYEGEKTPEVDAIFYSSFLGEEAGFTATPLQTPTGGEFKVWTNSSSYGWVATSYDAENSTQTNKIYYAGESWLISPVITLPEGDSYLNFMHALNYKNQEGLGVFIKIVGEDPVPGQTGDNWTELEVTWPGSLGWTFISSGDISLTPFGGHDIQIGLKYTGYTSKAATWEVKNFGIYEGTGGEDEPIEGLNGSGTAEDPYDVASALKLINENKIPSREVFVKGTITSLGDKNGNDMPGNSYGNATYFIGDVDASGAIIGNPLEVFRGYGLGGERITRADYIKVGDEVIVQGVLKLYNNSTPEFDQGSKIYSLNGQTSGGGDEEFGEPAGSGTKEDPYNVAATVRLIDGLGSSTSDYIYTKGIITSLGDAQGKDKPGNSYGNATYFISDMDANGNPTGGSLEVFRGYGLGGAEMTADYIKVGDVVVVYGKVKLYNGKTREFDQGSVLYSLNGETLPDVPEPEPKGSGTLEDPYNAAMANKVAKALAKDAKSDVVYIAGKVATIKNNGNYDAKDNSGNYYGNATFWISDDGNANNSFYVFQALYLGNKKYDGNGDLLKQGDDVIICGKLTNYQGTTAETAKGEAYLYSLNGNTGESGPAVEPGTYTNPWSVADVQANYKENNPINSFVKGYIVGYVKGSKYEEGALFFRDALETALNTSGTPTNLLISDNPQPSGVADCIPVQLPTGDIRNGLNLKDNQDLMGTQVLLYGSVDKFFSVAGLKSVSFAEYTMYSPTSQDPETVVIGNRPSTAKKRFVNKRFR